MSSEPSADLSRAIERVLSDPSATREQKVRRLLEMARDARAMDTATGEGMAPPEGTSGLARIRRALRDLGVEDGASSGP